jgi:hypothetical protein
MPYPLVIVVSKLPAAGMAIWPFILVKHQHLKHDEVLLRHEMIHLKQEIELLIVPFYILYLLNYLINRIKYKGHNKAYFNIAFEREAYINENNTNYLQSRRYWSWLKYL